VSSSRFQAGRWRIVAGALLALLAGCATSPSLPAVRAITPPAAASPQVARSVPVSLRIPAIGVDARLTQLGLNLDRTVQVPGDFGVPGWYRLGPSPGQRGSAVILGHIDSYRGPAVFYRLRDLHRGDRVDVRLADGVALRFAVDEVVMYPKTAFPDRLVYGPVRYSALNLVTCGGVFDHATRSYLSNVVVYTHLA
jgi:hypothetical protein